MHSKVVIVTGAAWGIGSAIAQSFLVNSYIVVILDLQQKAVDAEIKKLNDAAVCGYVAKRKISLNELSERVDLTLSNLSILKTGKAKAIRFSTLEAICKVLNCQPADILEYQDEE